MCLRNGSEASAGAPALHGGACTESGFTLSELLIAIAIVLLITLIAIPNLPGTRMQANENAAIASLRSIYQAEVKYETTYPTRGFACSLPALGTAPAAGAPTPAGAQVLERALAGGEKSGYTFTVMSCGKEAGRGDPFTNFQIAATPRSLGKTGHRGFCVDQQGEIRADPAGGSNCTQSLE